MLTVYGQPGHLASEACRAWLRDNKINFTFIEVNATHTFIDRVPTLVLSDKRGNNKVHKGFSPEAITFVLNNRENIQ